MLRAALYDADGVIQQIVHGSAAVIEATAATMGLTVFMLEPGTSPAGQRDGMVMEAAR